MSEQKNPDANRRTVSLKNLFLDPNNYRLINETAYVQISEADYKNKTVTQRTLRLLTGERNEQIQDLISSFKANGYLPVDQIQVRALDVGGYLVVEGNRRVATLKTLFREYEDKKIDLGHLEISIFSKVPVVMYADADELHHLTLMALKHISGNKKWAEWNQAKLLEKMHLSHGINEDSICKRVGISKVELRRSLRALSFLKQYQASDYGDQFRASQFSLFKEVVRNAALKAWLGWNDSNYIADHVDNRELFFSWLSQEPEEQEDETGQVGYNERYFEPVLLKRDDIRLLGKMIKDKKALDQLTTTRDINAAYLASDLVFRERREAALKSVAHEITALSQITLGSDDLPTLEDALGLLMSAVERTKASSLGAVEQHTVFHDHIDQHFSKLKIEHYKRLHGLSLTKLSRINLVAGLNNSGKTTLLEAIYLLCRQNDFSGLFEILRRRGKIQEDHMNPEWFTDQLPEEIVIAGCFDKDDAKVVIRHYNENSTDIDRAGYLESVEITTVFGQVQQESLTRLFKGRAPEIQAGGIKMLCPSIFSSPFFLNEPYRYTTYYHKSVQSKALPKILDFIREDVLPTLSDVRLVDKWQRFLVADSQYDAVLDLTQYGEGLQRIFFISLLFASAQNGMVLIDEFENAIHTELIADFAKFIDRLARRFNVQVFLTSHSKECIDAFVSDLPDIEALSACALVEEEGDIVVREFSGPEFKRLLDAGNVDLRRAR